MALEPEALQSVCHILPAAAPRCPFIPQRTPRPQKCAAVTCHVASGVKMICADTLGCFLPLLLSPSICPALPSHGEVASPSLCYFSLLSCRFRIMSVYAVDVLRGTTGGYPPHQPLCPAAGNDIHRPVRLGDDFIYLHVSSAYWISKPVLKLTVTTKKSQSQCCVRSFAALPSSRKTVMTVK